MPPAFFSGIRPALSFVELTMARHAAETTRQLSVVKIVSNASSNGISVDRPNGRDHHLKVARMKCFEKIIAGWLALCFALAGAVSLSPSLHQWVEHGGQGAGHVHYVTTGGGGPLAVWHHAAATTPPLPLPRPHPAVTVRSHAEGSGAGVLFSRLWRAVNKGCTESSPGSRDPSPTPDQPGHQHHSLPQLLAGGLVDQAIEFPTLAPPPVAVAFEVAAAAPPLPASAWNAQTATRGPPVAPS